MIDSVPTEITEQVSQACAVTERHLASTLQAIHLYGSALDGGLKPYSDIDLLVTVSARPDEAIRQALLLDLLTVSAPPGEDKALRALEVTVIAHNEVVPWRHPAKRELQFGEWLRKDLLAGIFEPPLLDIDLAIRNVSTIVRQLASEFREQSPALDCFQAVGMWTTETASVALVPTATTTTAAG
jgi:streptomycin 3"-adenylyltransferase